MNSADMDGTLKNILKKKRAFFVDGSSKLLGVPPMGKYSIDELSQIEEIVLKAIEDVPDGVGVINNLSTLIDYLDEDKVLEIMRQME